MDSGFNSLSSPFCTKENRIATAGQPATGGEAQIINEQGQKLAAGEVGELLVRGPYCAVGVFLRYNVFIGCRIAVELILKAGVEKC